MIPLTAIPFLSAFFLVTVGALIGYLVFARFKERLDQQISDAHGELARQRLKEQELLGKLDDLHTANRLVEDARDEALADLETVKRANLAAGLDLEKLHGALTEQTASYQQAAQQADRHLRELRETEVRLHTALTNVQDLEATNRNLRDQVSNLHDELTAVGHSFQTADSASNAMRRQITELKDQLDQLRLEVEQRDRRVRDLDAAYSKSKEEHRQWLNERNELTRRLTSLQSEAATMLLELHDFHELQSEAATLRRDLRTERQLRADLDARSQTLEVYLRQAQSEAQEMSQQNRRLSVSSAETEQRCRLAVEELQRLHERLDDVHREKEQLQHEFDTTRSDLDRLSDEVPELRDLLTEYVLENKQLVADRDQLANRTAHLEEAVAELEGQLEVVLSERASALSDAELATAAMRRLEADLKQATAAAAEYGDQLAAQSEITTTLREDNERLAQLVHAESKEAARALESLANLRGVMQQLQADNETLEQSRSEMVVELQTLQQEVVRLKGQLQMIEIDSSLQVDRASELVRQIEEAHRNQQRMAEQLAEERRQSKALRLEVDEAQESLRQVQRMRSVPWGGTVKSEVRSAFSFREVQRRNLTVAEQDRELLSRDGPFGLIYQQPPHHVDPLEAIVGIDSVIAEKLHAIGVYTFEQVMSWDASVVIAVSEHLNLVDEIDDDDWIGQARRLYHRQRRAA